MMIMCAQNNAMWHWAAGKYPGKVGMLYGPKQFHRYPKKFWMPYALDNDAYVSYSSGEEWSETAWVEMVSNLWRQKYKPLWALVPDCVGNKEKTLEMWHKYSQIAKSFKLSLAFAVQDGMEAEDVPKEGVSVVFVGGTTKWKWRTLPMWCEAFPGIIHVGRVNSIKRIYTCEDLGVISCDGSGWFMDTDEGKRAKQIIQWLEGNRQESGILPL